MILSFNYDIIIRGYVSGCLVFFIKVAFMNKDGNLYELFSFVDSIKKYIKKRNFYLKNN